MTLLEGRDDESGIDLGRPGEEAAFEIGRVCDARAERDGASLLAAPAATADEDRPAIAR